MTQEMAEYVVERARRPYPEYIGDGKYRVHGQLSGGRYAQVIFTYSPETVVYIIHCRPLTPNEISQQRRRMR
jgi:hypothetical protein